MFMICRKLRPLERTSFLTACSSCQGKVSVIHHMTRRQGSYITVGHHRCRPCSQCFQLLHHLLDGHSA